MPHGASVASVIASIAAMAAAEFDPMIQVGGAFVGAHGSWNHPKLNSYKVDNAGALLIADDVGNTTSAIRCGGGRPRT